MHKTFETLLKSGQAIPEILIPMDRMHEFYILVIGIDCERKGILKPKKERR